MVTSAFQVNVQLIASAMNPTPLPTNHHSTDLASSQTELNLCGSEPLAHEHRTREKFAPSNRCGKNQQAAKEVGTRSIPTWNIANAAFAFPWKPCFIAVFSLMLLIGCSKEKRSEKLLGEAYAAMQDQKFITAEEKAAEAGDANPDNGEAWLLAGDAAYSMEKWDDSLEYYQLAIGANAEVKHRVDAANRAAALWSNEIGNPNQAIQTFQMGLEIKPGHRDSLDGLSYVYSVAGRRWEAAPYFLELIKRARHQVGHLHGIGVLENVNYELQLLEFWIEKTPQDPNGHLGMGRIELDKNQPELAIPYLRKAVELDPTILEAQGRLGQALVDTSSLEEVQQWSDQLPKNANEHPEVWVARGMWLARINDTAGASRCYLECLTLNPNHRQAAFQLAKLLNGLGNREAAEETAKYAAKLLSYQETLVKAQQQPDNLNLLKEASDIAMSLGRYWEARGWLQVIMQVAGTHPQLVSEVEALNEVLADAPPQNLPESVPTYSLSRDDFPIPEWKTVTQVALESGNLRPLPEASSESTASQIRFEEISQDVGLDFEYFNGERVGRIGPRIFEVDGGGVAVLDFDLDQWPDLFFTQGNFYPRGDSEGQEYSDQLFLNIGGKQVVNVTEESGITDLGFGQGVAVGDFDQDGFPDLFIANLGQNRLFQNQGDGTFLEVTDSAGIVGEEWSSSVAMADINNDGNIDIYEVNYLKGDDLATRICPDPNNVPRICPPVLFEPEHDKLYFGNGDGTFRDASEEVGLRQSAGKGLGIVIADFENRNQLDIFVANDVVENSFYRNEPTPEKPFALVDLALLSGVAMDAFGNSQACMGVAVDDADHDGRLDLFITNFYQESNCLYLQRQPGIFSDESVPSKLAQPSFDVLGFGTQFIDADLDGNRDLILTNGHIVNETDLGVPYQMSPQFYRNLGEARFREIEAQSLGPFFTEPKLGRGLATLDFNRDGKEDFVISHLRTSASIVKNASITGEAKFLKLKLIGTESTRIPVGARVELTVAGQKRMRQLTSGSGYQSSNENCLIFGVGTSPSIDEMRVTWPNGEIQVWQNVPTNRELTLVQGETKLQFQWQDGS